MKWDFVIDASRKTGWHAPSVSSMHFHRKIGKKGKKGCIYIGHNHGNFMFQKVDYVISYPVSYILARTAIYDRPEGRAIAVHILIQNDPLLSSYLSGQS